MTLRVSGKNVDVGDALRSHIENRIEEAVTKYYDGGYTGHVTVGREGSGFRTECSLHLNTGASLKVSADSQDPRQSFDIAAERIDKRLRRYKRKLKDHHVHEGNGKDFLEAASYVLASTDEDEELPEDFKPVIVAETAAKVKTMTVGMAVMELDLTEAPVVMFRNAGNGGLNVVYRRSDGNVGWIDPALVAQTSSK